MDELKPNLDVFHDPRFAEWRPGNGKGEGWSFSGILNGLLALLFGA